MKRVEIYGRWPLLFFVLLIMAGCCRKTVYEGVIAVREERWRMEKQLPLSPTATDSLVQFIQWGGDTVDPGASAGPLPDSTYIRFFILLSDSNNCFKDSLIKSPDLTNNVASTVPREDVYDARQKAGPDEGGGRHAYLFGDKYWMIFYVEDSPLGYQLKKYNTLIVQKQFKVTGEK